MKENDGTEIEARERESSSLPTAHPSYNLANVARRDFRLI
jgi:hypothetical protein